MTKLLSVVFSPKLQILEVRVEDVDGKVRRVDVRWHSKDLSTPISNWYEIVLAEVEFQRTEEHNKKTGRFSY